ncbi:MAG: hypothetical protein C4557_00315 [Anaerolineaceae bacterium]|jgi:hypothetical protein|nr:MAG: hypothetical protein C4557_00315 [Anaerolineaceae bacterium]
MRKSTVFISTVLTMFTMATVAGAVSAYQQITKSEAEPVAEPLTVSVSVKDGLVSTRSVPQPSIVSPEEATLVAIEYLGDSSVYSVETVEYEGAPAYLVTFSSGKMIYVNPTGDILEVSEVQPIVMYAPAANNSGSSGGGGGGGNNSGGNYEDHDDDDDDDDDDHDDDDDDDDDD